MFWLTRGSLPHPDLPVQARRNVIDRLVTVGPSVIRFEVIPLFLWPLDDSPIRDNFQEGLICNYPLTQD